MSAPQPQVQVTLTLLELVVDGDFGPTTEAAVRGFQGNENLAVDGIVGRQTWTALLSRWLLQSAPG